MRRYSGAGCFGSGDMKISEGAYYRTRGGTVVGPIQKNLTGDGFKYYHEDGSFVGAARVMDLVSEVYVSDTPPADAPLPETIRLDPRNEWKLFRQMGPHELVTNASVPMLETKTLRDEFAMAALTGLLANAVDDGSMGAEDWASDAYLFADKMMEARKK
jgi:hypothetical protein